MNTKNDGVFQLENGYWGFRFAIRTNGKRVDRRRTKDEFGKPFRTKAAAIKARKQAMEKEMLIANRGKEIERRTFEEVYNEYCLKGRSGKAFQTIRKQDSLWNNHIQKNFGARYVDDVSVAEINDYLEWLYYTEGRAYRYVESFLKMFYLIFGQAYSRDYLDVDRYHKLCMNKETKIKMPKQKIDDETDIVVFSKEEMDCLTEYFKGTNIETAFMLGKYCGLRINECFGLKWEDIDLEAGEIHVKRQMQYQNGIIRLTSVKTRNAKRTIYIAPQLKTYLLDLQEKIHEAENEMAEQRKQNQMMIKDSDDQQISSLELVNTLLNGKIRTVNSVKFHTRKIKEQYNIMFKYHYLRHTYGTRLAELNTPTHLLCSQMGHASSKTTELYYLGVTERGIDILTENLSKI